MPWVVSSSIIGKGFMVSERDHLPGHPRLLVLNERFLPAGGDMKIASEPGRGRGWVSGCR